MANSEAVAHTPQPHIGEAYVGIKCSISIMYRGAVPITERPLPDDLEPLRGTVWSGGIQTPQRHYAPGASLALRSVPLWGWGYAKPLRGSRYIHFHWRDGGILTPVLL